MHNTPDGQEVPLYQEIPGSATEDKTMLNSAFPPCNTASERCADTSIADVERASIPPPESFALEFDLSQYSPENIHLQSVGDDIVVMAQQEVNRNGMTSLQKFNKTLQLPSHVDPCRLVARVGEDGFLTVSMPAPPDYGSVVESNSCTDCSSDRSEMSSM